MIHNSKSNITPDINVTYKSISGVNLPLSVFLPDGFDKSKKYPAVITVHGGGWYAVAPDSPAWMGGVMAHNAVYYRDMGFVGITFSYRSINLTPDTDADDLISDCADALRYIKDNLDYIDTENVVFLGDSAGGHIVLSLVMELGTQSSISLIPRLVVACNPVTDCACEKWSYSAKTENSRIKISPMHNIKTVSPKILLIHGTADTCVDINDSRKFFKKMKSAKNDIEMIELDGRKHAFIVYGFRDSDEAVSEVHEMIDRYINA